MEEGDLRPDHVPRLLLVPLNYSVARVTGFIKGQSATTDIMAFQASNTKLGSFKEADWIDWTVPTLTGNLPYDPFA